MKKGATRKTVPTNKKSLSSSDTSGGHKVKGLLNLGNTCFLNSALQNLLAIGMLRDHYMKMETSWPLSDSLKKLCIEVNPASGEHVVNPKPLFNSICAIAPHFKGNQEQDSHEVLGFLLNRLSSEETCIQTINSPTFVDVLFRGQIASTVTCLECGHTSVVYEPYLDISLPLTVPSKKLKPPPRRIVTRMNKTPDTTNGNDNSTVNSSYDLSWLDCVDPEIASSDQNVDASVGDYMVIDKAILQQAMKMELNGLKKMPPSTVDSLYDLSWMDCVDPAIASSDQNADASVGDYILIDEATLKQVIQAVNFELSGMKKTPPSTDDGLFDEPEEVVYGPAVGPVSNGVMESGCESKCDEVDNTDSQVSSLDECLAYFTACELLTNNEHTWHCEQCSKALIEQKNKLQECVSNGAENGNSNVSSDSVTDYPLSNVSSEVEEKNSLVNGEKSFSLQDTDSFQANGSSDNSKDEKVQRNGSNRVEENGVEKSGVVDSSKVKVTRDASKRILISKVPPILTIHLKRLTHDARGRLSKLNGHVDFKEVMDLKPYMDPSCCKDRDTYNYRLIGVIEHLGTMRGGHYVAYVRGPAAKGNNDWVWYHASDADVKQVSFEEVLRCEAYILFYEEM